MTRDRGRGQSEAAYMARERLLRDDFAIPVTRRIFGTPPESEPEWHVVESVRRTLQLDFYGDLIYIKGVGNDPQLITKVANSYAEQLVEETRSKKVRRSGQYAEFYEEELSEKKAALKEKEAELARFSAAHQGSLPEDVEMHNLAIERLNKELARAQIDLQAQREERNAFLATIPITPALELMPGVPVPEAENPLVRLRGLESELAELRLRLTEKHPDVQNKVREIAALKERISTRPRLPSPEELSEGASRLLSPETIGTLNYNRLQLLDREIRRLESQVGFTRKEITGHEAKINLANRAAVEWATLTRERDALAEEYSGLLENARRSALTQELTEDLQGDSYRLLERATVPESPVSPNPRKFIIAGLIVGIMLSIGAVFLMESLDQTYKSAEDLTRDLGVPVVATIVRMEEVRKMRRPATPRRKVG
jgi:uncharacterized protein involved in exopolysaccharide biosynthesis